MIEFYDTTDLVGAGLGWPLANDDPDDFFARERRRLLQETIEAMAQIDRSARRRDQRERVRNALNVIRAANRAGLAIKAATVEGVRLEFGEPAKIAPDDSIKRRKSCGG
jgi:hypothetical protein